MNQKNARIIKAGINTGKIVANQNLKPVSFLMLMDIFFNASVETF